MVLVNGKRTSARNEGKTRILAVLEDHKKETVATYLRQIPQELLATIQNVCTDMYEGYLGAVQAVLAETTEIVIDRFHVAQAYRKGADRLRKRNKSV